MFRARPEPATDSVTAPADRRDADAELDAFDRRILVEVQADVRRSAAVVGERIGLSATAVQRRLQRLRDARVIVAEVAVVDPARVGLPVTVIVQVNVEREGGADLDEFRERMLACAEVRQCWYVTGETDYVLVVDVPDMAAYEAFTRRALIDGGNVRRFTSQVVMGEIRRGPSVRVEPLEDGPP